jgi:F-type H+-transporting ATPase subunit b
MRSAVATVARVLACETPRKLALAATLVLYLGGAPLAAFAQPADNPHPAGQTAQAAEEHHGGRGLVDTIARLVNFAILAGTLFYVLRSPLRTYLADRSGQIRHDLVHAAEIKQLAAAQIEEIERKMAALPGELEALRAEGARETAAEEARIQAAAAAERDRLLEQTRREIDLQVKVAERELVSHAADLALGLASDRIKQTITDEDQQRLVDRYVQQLRR